jgi:hypothetical protein
MKASLLGTFLLTLATTTAAPQTQLYQLIARAKSLELDTPYVPPPGDPLAHHAAGYAKIMCSAVFITGLTPDFAAENVGFFTAPYEIRAILGKPVIDHANQAVHVTLPNGAIRTAKYLGSQGCVTLPFGESGVHFTPVAVKSQLPDAATEPWPMGDVLPKEALPAEIDATKLKAAVEGGFRAARGPDCGLRRHLERPPHRRALCLQRQDAHTSGRLVHGEEHYRNAVRHPAQQRRI